jgi:SAM-dependent methyltransferase
MSNFQTKEDAMGTDEKQEMLSAIRSRYADLAAGAKKAETLSCRLCGTPPVSAYSQDLGYSARELEWLPAGADLGLGCGNPQTLARLEPGETILDLGSGAGIDCFLAADRVGPDGRVIGVDMTPEMIDRARQNAQKAAVANVEFRLGTIERLPVSDDSVDVIISNCVVNLSTDKPAAFAEAFRVLKPGGRLAISDIVALEPLAEAVRTDLSLVSSCVGGAETVERLEAILNRVGFEQVSVKVRPESAAFISNWLPESGLETQIASAEVTGVKPFLGQGPKK